MKNEMKTSNLIIKTIVVLLIFSLFITAVFMVFFPKTVANVAKSLGMQEVAVSFEKASYEKTGDINSLSAILNYEIYCEDYQSVASYGMEMLNHKHYEEYVAFKGVSSVASMDYASYVETYILQALYLEGLEDEAYAVLSGNLAKGYETFGVGIILCGEVSKAGDDEFANKMLELYESNLIGASDMKQYNIILEGLKISSGNVHEIWEERLETLNEKFA